MAIYNAGDVINHTLIARKNVPILKSDLKTVISTASPGQSLGVVFSWVGGDGLNPLHWQFVRNDGTFYYVKHEGGAFDIDSLSKELALDNKYDLDTRVQQAEEEKKKAEMGAFAYYVQKWGGTVLAVGVGAYVLKAIIDNSGNRRK